MSTEQDIRCQGCRWVYESSDEVLNCTNPVSVIKQVDEKDSFQAIEISNCLDYIPLNDAELFYCEDEDTQEIIW